MRQIFIDTETTGLYPLQGHRIIELAAVEMLDRRVTGEVRHWYLNPEREVDVEAAAVHGMTWNDLKDKPLFAAVAEEFLAFCKGAEWIIHNAPFDIGFLDAELTRLKLPVCKDTYGKLTDTLQMARAQFPGKRNNLDALCERLGVSNAHRTLHGACLDAQLLADVYLALTRGQESLVMTSVTTTSAAASITTTIVLPADAAPLKILHATAEERDAHASYLSEMKKKGRCLWPDTPDTPPNAS